MKYEVRVQLKSNVLNVEAKEILSSIKSHGFHSVASLSTAKLFIIEVLNDDNPDSIAEEIAKNILTNEIIEKFSIEKINE
jgi:phosphoribosylformylglycinamidine synthase PurS subunit